MRDKTLKLLILVLWIAGVIAAAILTGSFSRFGVKARQAEAKANLSAIYTFQRAYFEDYQRFGTISDGGCGSDEGIGFRVADCKKARYEYAVERFDENSFVAVAREKTGGDGRLVFPGCKGRLDEWEIDQDKNLRARHDAARFCDTGNSWFIMLSPRQMVISIAGVLFCFLAVFVLDLPLIFLLLGKTGALRTAVMTALVTGPLLPLGIAVSGWAMSALRKSGFFYPGAVVAVLVAALIAVRVYVLGKLAPSRVIAVMVAAAVPLVFIAAVVVPFR